MAHHITASVSASASSSAYSASTHYDVFINHHGQDVKKTFAGHLYRSLSSRGLRVFLDQPELQAGHTIISQLEAAIQAACVQIAIFSPSYAESRWCLDELVLMVESEMSGATIVPVFYKVEPSELRWTGKDKDGAYAVALRKHEERYDSHKIQSWRDALSHVAGISGFVLGACNGDEAELLEKVVQRVLKKVPEPALHVAKYATGLREKVEDFEKTVLSQQERRVKVLGIVGSGGVGKTTLAKEFFNCKKSNYDGCSFLGDVREKTARSFLHSLQSKLIKDLKGINVEIDSCEQGLGLLEKNLRSHHALIILDDVDDADQLDAFLPIKDVLHSRSLILVTSRNKHALISAGIAKSSIYHLKGLDAPHSQELFCSHAFFQPHPRPGFENLVLKFVNSCGGLPLSLKVFGALLCEKDESYWEEKLSELQKLPRQILASLKISYDSLDREEQQIFLDIACFGIGEEKDKWVRIWGGLAGLQSLEDRCLIEIDTWKMMKMMRMHDHLRDMGRNIAEEISMPRRLWRSIEDVHDLFEEQSASSAIPKVRGIRMPCRKTFGFPKEEELLRSKSEIPLNKNSSHEAFRVKKLQLLEAEGEFVEGILSRVRSPNLLWLRWNDCPCSSLPSWIPMDNLKVLEVNGRELKKLWQSDSQAPLQLRELYVDAPLLEFPRSLVQMKYLEKIIINFSEYFPQLSTLPEEFSHLRSLKHLRLRGCLKLEILPSDFGNLKNLQLIDLSLCDSLKKLPISLGNLTNLQHIDLSQCRSLQKLPSSFGNLTNLQHIDLSDCRSLEKLPSSLGNLTNLQHINLLQCSSLKKLPRSLGNLTNLQHIDLSGCSSLMELPISFGNLKNLQHMDLSFCQILKMLPNSLENLTNLLHINLKMCRSLEMLPNSLWNLTKLQHMDLSCHSAEVESGYSMMNSTRPQPIGSSSSYDIYVHCYQTARIVKKFPNSSWTFSYFPLDLSACQPIGFSCHTGRWKKLPNSLGNLIHLQHIDLSEWSSLEMIPDSFGDLKNLKIINMSGCESLKMLPDSFVNLSNLQSLNLFRCRSLKILPDCFGNLRNLQYISLGGASNLQMLPNSFGNLLELKHLHLSDCFSLAISSETIGNITTLECLDLSGCIQMELLPPQVGRQQYLKNLNLLGSNLKDLTLPFTAVCLTNLEVLVLGSPFLKVLPLSLGYLTRLKELRLYGCQELKCLPDSVGLLTQLTLLDIWKCGIQYLPPAVMKLNNLSALRVRRCPLRALPFKKTDGERKTVRTASVPRGRRRIKLRALRELHSSIEKGMFQIEKRVEMYWRRRTRRASRELDSSNKGMFQLKTLELYCTEIREVSFPQGVCPNLEYLMIKCCDHLEEVGALPATLRCLGFMNCVSLRIIKGRSDLANLQSLQIMNIFPSLAVEDLQVYETFNRLRRPVDSHNLEIEEQEEQDMRQLQEGLLWQPPSNHNACLFSKFCSIFAEYFVESRWQAVGPLSSGRGFDPLVPPG